MAVTHSLTLVATVADRTAANTYFKGLGWGDAVLVVPLSPTGQLPVTHYAAHDMHTAEMVATLLAAKTSTDTALAGLDPVFLYPVESNSAQFDAAIASAECVSAFGSALRRYYEPMDY